MDEETLARIERIRRHDLFGSIFCQYHPQYFKEFAGFIHEIDTSHDLSAVKGGVRKRVGTFKHADYAEYLQDCATLVPTLLAQIEQLKMLIPDNAARQP